jgi:hypothetical protein
MALTKVPGRDGMQEVSVEYHMYLLTEVHNCTLLIHDLYDPDIALTVLKRSCRLVNRDSGFSRPIMAQDVHVLRRLTVLERSRLHKECHQLHLTSEEAAGPDVLAICRFTPNESFHIRQSTPTPSYRTALELPRETHALLC